MSGLMAAPHCPRGAANWLFVVTGDLQILWWLLRDLQRGLGTGWFHERFLSETPFPT